MTAAAACIACLALTTPPAQDPPPGRGLARASAQMLGGTAAGAAAALPPLFLGMSILLCDNACGNEDLGGALVLAVPFVYALGDAAAVYLIGRAFDRERSGRFAPTLLGAVVGSVAGTLLIGASGWEGAPAWLGGMALGTAGAIVGYNASRPPEPAVSVRRGGLELGLAAPRPREARLPDGRVAVGAELPGLVLRF